MRSFCLLCGSILMFPACGDSDTEPPTGDVVTHIVGSDAAAYAEADDTANNSDSTAEDTGYTLDVAGLVISGTFSGNADYYRFSTADFGRMDAKVFLGSAAGEQTVGGNQLALDAFTDDGYSTLTGQGYFINAWIQPGMTYVIGIYSPDNTDSGAPYTLEMKGNPEG